MMFDCVLHSCGGFADESIKLRRTVFTETCGEVVAHAEHVSVLGAWGVCFR